MGWNESGYLIKQLIVLFAILRFNIILEGYKTIYFSYKDIVCSMFIARYILKHWFKVGWIDKNQLFESKIYKLNLNNERSKFVCDMDDIRIKIIKDIKIYFANLRLEFQQLKLLFIMST